MKKILITGANGQLGQCLRRIVDADPELEPTYIDIEDLDLTNRDAVAHYMRDAEYDYIVNCAAYTAVDKAEKDELKASLINTGAVGILAEQARRCGSKMIHISTDYVYSGENFRPYDEHDEPYPRSIYGRTKLEGEGVLTAFCPESVILRTSWLYSEFGTNFVKTILGKLKAGEEVHVVSDQVGTPTYAPDLAGAIVAIMHSDNWKPGIYHYSNEGVASWYDLAKAVARIAGTEAPVIPVDTKDWPAAAHRPQYAVLNKAKIKKTFSLDIPYWQDSLARCIAELRGKQ